MAQLLKYSSDLDHADKLWQPAVMFIPPASFVVIHAGNTRDASIYEQVCDPSNWRLAPTGIAIHVRKATTRRKGAAA